MYNTLYTTSINQVSSGQLPIESGQLLDKNNLLQVASGQPPVTQLQANYAMRPVASLSIGKLSILLNKYIDATLTTYANSDNFFITVARSYSLILTYGKEVR